VKNKIAPPFRRTEFDILFNQGISREGDVVDLAVLHRVIEKSGSWMSYKGERIGQGRDRAKAFLMENPETLKKMEGDVKAAAASGAAVAVAGSPDFGGEAAAE
jgi:recombination protein RecA